MGRELSARRWLRLGLLVFIVSAVLAGRCACSEPDEAPPSVPQSAKDVFENCVNPLDGNHDEFEALIRDRLNDPSSMDTHGTYYDASDSISDGSITIRLDYSAANAYGGMVRTDANAEMRNDCSIKEVITYGW